MNVILFGTTGMVGQGILRECMLDDDVKSVLSVGRSVLDRMWLAKHSAANQQKFHEIILANPASIATMTDQLRDYDACFYTLGASAVGLSEAKYSAINYDLTLAVAQTLVSVNPNMTFIYVSGRGTDSSEQGNIMWARVKGKTENALLRLPFKAAYMFRPAGIQPMHGVKSKTFLYNVVYGITWPLMPLFKLLMPTTTARYMTTTEHLGRAMLKVAKLGAAKHVLETEDINAI